MPNNPRLVEIDFCRGIAIFCMLIFHLVFDLAYFYDYPLNYRSGVWFYIGKLSAILFIFICGISTTFNQRHFRHGMTVLLAAALVSLFSYWHDPILYIRFGILHFLGISILCSRVLSKRTAPQLIFLSCSALLLGLQFDWMTASTDALLIFGLTSRDFASYDYYPLFPWSGLFLSGILFGRKFYAAKKPLFLAKPCPAIFSSMGRHSLLIYLIHQPLFLLLLMLFNLLLQKFMEGGI